MVQTSLLATGTYTVGSDLAVQLRFGRLSSNRSRREPLNPLANFFQSAEGRWFVTNPRGGSVDWAAMATAAGRPELLDDPRFSSGRLRKENTAALTAAFDEAFGALAWDEITARLDAADLVWWPLILRSAPPAPWCRWKTRKADLETRRPRRLSSPASISAEDRRPLALASTPGRFWLNWAMGLRRSKRCCRRARPTPSCRRGPRTACAAFRWKTASPRAAGPCRRLRPAGSRAG